MADNIPTPLIKKPGIKPGFKIILVNIPEIYFELIEKDPKDLNIQEEATQDVDFIHLFVLRSIEVVEQIPFSKQQLKPSGRL